MDQVSVVVAHDERATLRVGGVFIKVDADPARLANEVTAMRLAPVPTADVLWHKPQALAVAALSGSALGRLGRPDSAPAAAWRAAGAAVRVLHDAPVPDLAGRLGRASADELERECRWLVDEGVLPREVVERHRALAATVLRPFESVFGHGDLQVEHVFVDGDSVTGVLDWSEAGPGDPLFDLATLTLGHPERLPDVLAGYGGSPDTALVEAWWSWRCLTNIRWLIGHGFDPFAPGCEADLLRRRA